eukprot:6202587-Pleurochrysis_carterae.AAC.2
MEAISNCIWESSMLPFAAPQLKLLPTEQGVAASGPRPSRPALGWQCVPRVAAPPPHANTILACT